MPTINKLPKKQPSPRRNDEEKRKMRQEAYNSTQWKKLRLHYMKLHPLCEECAKKHKVTPAGQVHHKKSPFTNEGVNWELFLDPNNLESICAECHGLLHSGKEMKAEDVLKELERIMDENIPDEEFE